MTNFIIICHGKSEVILAKWLAKETRVKIDVDSKNGGNNSVMINSLLAFLEENDYYDSSRLKKRYPNIEYKNRKGFKDLRIFIVMDVDNDVHSVHDYLSKQMFRDCPLRDCIVPILNDKDLDSVFRDIGFEIDGNNKPESYRVLLNSLDVDDLLELLRGCDGTNMDEMIEELLRHDPSHQGK